MSSNSDSNQIDDVEQEKPKELDEKKKNFYEKWLIFFSIWNFFFGIIMMFTAFLLDAYNLSSLLTRILGACYILASALCFLAKMTKFKPIFYVLAGFSIVSSIVNIIFFISIIYTVLVQKEKTDLAKRNMSLSIIDVILNIINLTIYAFSIHVFILFCRLKKQQEDVEDGRHESIAINVKNETTLPDISDNI